MPAVGRHRKGGRLEGGLSLPGLLSKPCRRTTLPLGVVSPQRVPRLPVDDVWTGADVPAFLEPCRAGQEP